MSLGLFTFTYMQYFPSKHEWSAFVGLDPFLACSSFGISSNLFRADLNLFTEDEVILLREYRI